MKIIFARNNHWISRVVRFRTRSEWSHVGIIDGDNVLEARGAYGVVLTPIAKFMHRYDKTEIRYLPGNINKAKALIGRPFDMRGLYGHLIGIPAIHHKFMIFCSELVAIAADDIDDDDAHNYTPDRLCRLSSDE